MIRKIGLTGIPYTSPFAIEVAQRGLSASGQTDNWGGAENPWGEPTPGVAATIKLVKRSNLQCAPEGFRFAVDLAGFDISAPADKGAYDLAHHDIYYFWDFGDPGSRFTAPQNVLEHQRDADKGYGPTAAHVYNTPGAKTVQVLVIEPSSGKVAQAQFQIGGIDTPVIRDPNVVFPGNKTLVVDTTGVGISGYQGSVVFTNPNAAVTYTYNKAGPYRIMLRDGQNFTTTGDMAFGSITPAVHIVREGRDGGVKPTVTYGGSGSRTFYFADYDTNNNKDFVIDGVDFFGPWDDATETGKGNISCIVASAHQGDYLLVNNAAMSNFSAHAYVALSFTNETGVRFFCNSVTEGNRSYHFYEEINAPASYLGMRSMGSVNALSGGPRNGNHNDAAIYRFQSAKDVVLDGCDVFVRTGWFENYFGIITQQAAIRCDQRANRGSRLNMQRCSVEGSVTIDRMASNVGTNVQNNLIERCVLVGSAFDQRVLRISHGGATVRNNVMIHVNTPRINFYGLFNPGYFVETILYEDAGAQTGNVEESRAGPIKIYNNTGISLMSDANGGALAGFANLNTNGGTYTSVMQVNNVIHAPNAATPQELFEPFETVPLWTPRHIGYKASYERIEVIIPSTVAIGASITLPYPTGRGASDYASPPAEPHRIGLNSHKNANPKVSVDVTFDAGTLTATNTTNAPWPAGEAVLVLFCPDSPVALPQYASNGQAITLYHPAEDSAAIGTADDDLCAVGDFFGNFRPVHPSMGALEVQVPS